MAGPSSCSGPYSRMSLTIPTMVIHWRGGGLCAKVICLPSGSSEGKYWRAIDSLITPTSGAPSRSELSNPRPLTMGMRRAEKYVDETRLVRMSGSEPSGTGGRPLKTMLWGSMFPESGSSVTRADPSAPGICATRVFKLSKELVLRRDLFVFLGLQPDAGCPNILRIE